MSPPLFGPGISTAGELEVQPTASGAAFLFKDVRGKVFARIDMGNEKLVYMGKKMIELGNRQNPSRILLPGDPK